MRRLQLLIALVLLTPAVVVGQPRLMLGGGVSTPNGDVTEVAGTGFHAQAGLFVAIPTLPVGLRADGVYHRLGAAGSAFDRTGILGGNLSMVFTLPGVGLSPYFFGGLGSYRTELGAIGVTETVTDTGYHGGFGVNVGTGGLGGFAEIRYLQISGDARTIRLIPLTLGLRL
jgi:hypothetical protein